MIPIDEQIEYMQSIVATSMLPTHMPKAILASLELLKQVTAERDACAQMIDDQARRVFAAEAELAATKRLLVEAREEGRITGLREAAEMVEMTDLSKVADPSWKLFFADMFIQIAANIRAAEGMK